jgi:hypothetical protein
MFLKRKKTNEEENDVNGNSKTKLTYSLNYFY